MKVHFSFSWVDDTYHFEERLMIDGSSTAGRIEHRTRYDFFYLNCLGMMREIVSLPLQAINVELMGIFY